jgi:hypothetical protein
VCLKVMNCLLSSSGAVVQSTKWMKDNVSSWYMVFEIQGDSKLLSGFPWPIIFKPELTK